MSINWLIENTIKLTIHIFFIIWQIKLQTFNWLLSCDISCFMRSFMWQMASVPISRHFMVRIISLFDIIILALSYEGALGQIVWTGLPVNTEIGHVSIKLNSRKQTCNICVTLRQRETIQWNTISTERRKLKEDYFNDTDAFSQTSFQLKLHKPVDAQKQPEGLEAPGAQGPWGSSLPCSGDNLDLAVECPLEAKSPK